MKTCTKALVSVMLLFVVLVFLPHGSAEAATTKYSGTWRTLSWKLDSDGLLTISGSGEMEDFPWDVSTSAWRNYKNEITRAVIGYGVTSLGNYAFYDCENLTSVTIPSSVTRINDDVFRDCENLTGVTIPSSVTSIGTRAFYRCYSLTSIIIPSSVKSIGGEAFQECTRMESVTIPSSVTSIGEWAFAQCPLTSITIPSSVTSLSEGVFCGCNLVTSITIPSSVTSIGVAAFEDCLSLKSITIPSSVTSIGSEAFLDCRKLTSITIPDGVTEIHSRTFDSCYDLTSITIPSSVTTIGNRAFERCRSLTSITIPSNVTTIEYSAFSGCESLTSVTIPDGVTSIANGTFDNCHSLSYITIPDGVTSIGYRAFFSCESMTNITIPSSVTSIGESAFERCNGLTDVYYSGTVSDWNAINIKGSNEPLLSAAIHCGGLINYTVAYNANGGTNAPEAQTKIHGTNLTLSSAKPTRISTNGSYTVTLNANGGNVSPSSLSASRTTSYTFKNWNTAANGSGTSYNPGATYSADASVTLYAQWNSSISTSAVTLPSPTRSGYSFKGWSTSSSAGSGFTGTYTPTGNVTLYAVWDEKPTYTVTYSANGGTGTPSPQVKEENVPLTLSTGKPTKKYVIQYNAAGGSVSPASKNVSCTFKSWNTSITGSGTSYAPGSQYTANANVTLHAQWTNPTAGTLDTPTRTGYDFAGWFTSSSGGTAIRDTTTITGNITIFAHWTAKNTDPYNMGDETYSFENYGDSDSFGGHCFGMSMTSAGYHNGLLDIKRLGGNASSSLYSFSKTSIVKKPICYYQGIQGSYASRSIVAGGSSYLYGYSDINSDWSSVVNFVSNHKYDGTGLLQIGFRKNNEGGHAINFLRYERVNGQDRIYAYDNNFPDQETYFYRDYAGKVRQTPMQTFSGPIDCIALRDCRIYFNSVGDFNATHVLYMPKDAAAVQGYTYSYMEGNFADEEFVMYEIPADQDRVIIVPKRDNADFIYMDTEYSFGNITDDTRGEFKFASLSETGGNTSAEFRIVTAALVFGEPDFILPAALVNIEESAFEEIAAKTVYIPDTCSQIGPYAFRNASIAQVRIPARCMIADTAFEGCAMVEIFGTPGSAAETFCAAHDNCTFVAEAE